MDKLDGALLRLLNENARTSFRGMARRLRVSLATVASRIKRLEREGVITGYAPLIDAQKLGFDLVALVFVRIARGKLLAVQERIARDERVYGVYDITGEWDSLIVARFRNRKELNDFIKVLVATEYIERTNTSIALNILKEERRVLA